MIFSLLKIRKKTSAVLAGITCGIACIWGIAYWQKLSLHDILNMLLGSLFLLGGIMLAALCLVVLFSVLRKLLSKLTKPE